MFITKYLHFTIENTYHCEPGDGYAVAIVLAYGKSHYSIINVHFPEEFRSAGHHNLDHLIDWFYLMAKTDKNLIILGDFNCVLNNELDSLNRQDKKNHYVKQLKEFCKQFKLVDPYRELYPNKHVYTHASLLNCKKKISAHCLCTAGSFLY